MGQKTNITITNLSLKNSEWNNKYLEKNSEESSLLLYKNIKIKDYLNRIFSMYGFLVHTCKIEYGINQTNFIIFLVEKKSETQKIYSENLKQLRNNNTKSLKLINSKNLLDYIVNNILTVDLSLFLKAQTITIQTQNLNKKFENSLTKPQLIKHKNFLKTFKRFLRNPLFKESLKLLFIAVSEKNSSKLIAEIISNYFSKEKKRHGFGLFFFKKSLSTLINTNFSKISGIKVVISGRFNSAPRAAKKILRIGKISLQSFNSSTNYHETTSFTNNGTFGIKVWICEK